MHPPKFIVTFEYAAEFQEEPLRVPSNQVGCKASDVAMPAESISSGLPFQALNERHDPNERSRLQL